MSGPRPAIDLHIYGGDSFMLRRRMWSPEMLEEGKLNWSSTNASQKLHLAPAALPRDHASDHSKLSVTLYRERPPWLLTS